MSKLIRWFFYLVAITGFIFVILYSPLFLSPSSVNVINNLNVYSSKLKDSLSKTVKPNLEVQTKGEKNGGEEKKGSFHGHNSDSGLKVVQEEKVPGKKEDEKVVKVTKKPFEKLPEEKVDKKPETKGDEKKEESKSKTTEKPAAVKKDELPDCSSRGTNLVGPMFVDQSIPKDMNTVEKLLSVEYGGTVEKGGTWSPTTCKPKRKVAIVIPYRRRMSQLKIFLKYMHPFLQKQLLDYRIFLVEQLYNDPFNRAGLFNIGFIEALKVSQKFDCFIFTDVDLLPEDDRNYYGCPTSPRHMSVAVDKFNYRLPYATLFGGVGAFFRHHFEEVNGMSNLFFGWGGEDDDLYKRVKAVNLEISRPPQQIGRYTMISVGHHQSSKQDPNIISLLNTSEQRMVADGLNTLQYKVKSIIETPLVTIFRVVMKKSMYNLT